MKKIFVLAFSVITLAAFSQSPTGKIVVKPGQHFKVESISDGTIAVEMMAQSMEIKVGNTTKITADIKDAANNNYTITQTLTNIKSSFSGMGQEKTFDSEKKEDMDGEAGMMFKDKINVPKDVVISNQGKIIASAADTSKSGDKQDGSSMDAIMDMMGGGKDVVSTSMFLVIPAGKKAGDTWQDSTSEEGVKVKRTFTLNSIAKKEASVTIDGVIDINKTMQVQGMDMNTVMTSKIKSEVLVDLISNIQKENKSTTDLTGTIDIMGQSAPITSKATSLTTVRAL
jgi:hypothetical protein